MASLSPSAAWKHVQQTNGNVQNLTPGSFGLAPANFMSVAYNAAQLINVSADDANIVQNIKNHVAGTTGRSNHQYEYDIPNPGARTGIDDLGKFHHTIAGNNTPHVIKLYAYDYNLAAWEELDSDGGSGIPRDLEGSLAGPTFADYVSGGKLHIIMYDYEGVYQVTGGGGGCIVAGQLVQTPSGLALVESLRPRDIVYAWLDGKVVEAVVYYAAKHRAQFWDLREVTTPANGRIIITDNHEVPTEADDKAASAVKTGEEADTDVKAAHQKYRASHKAVQAATGGTSRAVVGTPHGGAVGADLSKLLELREEAKDAKTAAEQVAATAYALRGRGKRARPVGAVTESDRLLAISGGWTNISRIKHTRGEHEVHDVLARAIRPNGNPAIVDAIFLAGGVGVGVMP